MRTKTLQANTKNTPYTVLIERLHRKMKITHCDIFSPSVKLAQGCMAALCPSVSTTDMTTEGYFYKQTIRAGALCHVYLQSFKN